jgi:hypothetical protein
MSKKRGILRCAAALFFCLAVGGGPAREEGVKLSVVAILASEDSTKVDPRLKCIARELQKMNPKLTGFRIATMTYKTVKVGADAPFDLVDDQSVSVTVERGTDKDHRVQLKVGPPLLTGEVTYDTVCGKYLPIITRYRTKNNEQLILAIRVQPCPK